MTDSVEPLLISPREAARLLSISQRTLWKLTQDGVIPRVKMGRSVRYSVEGLRQWLAEHSCAQK